MYQDWFRIKENIWNNAFSYDIRKLKNSEPQIYVTNLIQWTIDDVQIWDKIVFEEINSKWQIQSFVWLKNFVKLSFAPLEKELSEGLRIYKESIPIYIFDNHNHALFFRYQKLLAWNISRWINLIHIDQHTDMNINLDSILKNSELKDIFQFTNYRCNVWNFITPAIQDWLISKVIQINTEHTISTFDFWLLTFDYILDIDLDFRHPNMWIEEYNKSIEITQNLISQASLVTIATSPYFMDQILAIKILKDIFSK
jgi:hypothetical protein